MFQMKNISFRNYKPLDLFLIPKQSSSGSMIDNLTDHLSISNGQVMGKLTDSCIVDLIFTLTHLVMG